AGIYNQKHGLTSLHLVHFADQLAVPCCSRPANIADFVRLTILAQAFELAPSSYQALQPSLLLDLPATHQVKCVAFGFTQVRVNADRLAEVSNGPTLCEPDWAAIAQKNPAHLNVAPSRGVNHVGRRAAPAGRNRQHELRQFPAENGR